MLQMTPFRYQLTDYDCVPTAFLNGIAALFERREIPPTVVQRVYLYTLDTLTPGQIQGRGTTRPAIEHICAWLESKKEGSFDIRARCKGGRGATRAMREIRTLVEQGDPKLAKKVGDGACVLLRICTNANEWHFVTVIAVDAEGVLAFDPCPSESPGDGVTWSKRGGPKLMERTRKLAGQVPNVRLSWDRVLSEEGKHCMGPEVERQVVLLRRLGAASEKAG